MKSCEKYVDNTIWSDSTCYKYLHTTPWKQYQKWLGCASNEHRTSSILLDSKWVCVFSAHFLTFTAFHYSWKILWIFKLCMCAVVVATACLLCSAGALLAAAKHYILWAFFISRAHTSFRLLGAYRQNKMVCRAAATVWRKSQVSDARQSFKIRHECGSARAFGKTASKDEGDEVKKKCFRPFWSAHEVNMCVGMTCHVIGLGMAVHNVCVALVSSASNRL